MIVSITGTPGTGKSSVSEILAEELGFKLLDVNEVAFSEEVGTSEGDERDTTEVDIDTLIPALEEEVGENSVLEGHLSHYFPSDLVVVLRTMPEELKKRLEEKGWSEEKVEENLESEVLDGILQEAVNQQEDVVEVDTTGKSPGETAKLVKKLVENKDKREEYRPGTVSWDLDKYLG
ncbi:MAG: adenylate kinase family protein [Candidatus Nanohaloarchaeota archaeon QJJ-9]|nr:adenylate kinase family protein [Candidatus Nanohaloarchaeota archaeon QJJ-9]